MSLKDAILDLFGFVAPEPEPRPAPKAKPNPRPSPDPRVSPAQPAAAPAEATPRNVSRAASLRRHLMDGARDEAAVLAVANAAGGGFRHVVFTNNRRVMASVGDGATLRLNVAFATAPDDVLRAVATLFTTRDGRKRNGARAALRAFLASLPANPAPPRRRARRVYVEDVAHLARLQAEFDRVNAAMFDGALPRVPLYLSGQMRRRNGHFSSHPPEIVISLQLCEHAAPGESEATLRHEMIHLWQHATGRPVDHGREFRRMARRLDVHPRATRPVRWTGGEPPRRRRSSRRA